MSKVHAIVEELEFTLFYDYDQLRDKKLSKLTDAGKVQWFLLRMDMVFIDPLGRIFDTKSPAHLELNSSPDDEKPRTIMIGAFAMLLNGIESCGSFVSDMTPKSKRKNWERFKAFMTHYMHDWNVEISGTSHREKNMILILWEHFRNGIAHGFCVANGGIEYIGKRWHVHDGILEIDPLMFFQDFLSAKDRFFDDIKRDGSDERRIFLKRFSEVYPH